MLPYLWMLCGAVAFACMGSLAHGLREHCGWQLIAMARSLVPLALTGLMAVAGGVELVFWRPASLWIRSIAGSISLVCTFFAFTRLPISDVLTLTNLFPVWVALLAWPLLGQRPTVGVWLAIGAGLVGVALVQQPHLAEGNYASLAALVSSLASAVAMIGLHRLHRIDARAIVFHFSAVSLSFCLGSLLVFRETTTTFPPLDALRGAMLIGVGVSATVGQFCLTKAFILGAPAKVSVVGLSQVALGVLIDRLVWGRVFSPLTILGILLVLTPTAWVLLHRRAPREAAAEV